jgi:hypothetical protein
VALLDVCVGARYCAKLIRKETCPRIATWLIFEIGVVMSLAAHFASHDHSIVKAALNVTNASWLPSSLRRFLSNSEAGKSSSLGMRECVW